MYNVQRAIKSLHSNTISSLLQCHKTWLLVVEQANMDTTLEMLCRLSPKSKHRLTDCVDKIIEMIISEQWFWQFSKEHL